MINGEKNLTSSRLYNILKNTIGQGYDYTTRCMLFHPYFKKNCKMITIDLSKQQPLDADTKAKEQINSTANLQQLGNTSMSFSIEEAKETILDF